MQTTKLTLEHLSIYLPYGLMLQTEDRMGHKYRYRFYLNNDDEFVERIESGDLKPILKPLTTEIEAPHYIRDEISHLANKHMHLSALSFATIQAMGKNHLDIFSLIEKDLAINYFDTI